MSAAIDRQPQTRWVDAIVLMVCQSSQALTIGGVALFLPLIRHQLHLTFAQAGTLDAASTLMYALMQIPAGLIADRLGPRRLVVLGLFGIDLLAFSFSLQHEYVGLVANQALTGFFRALVFAPGMILMGRLFAPARRATAMGLYVAGGVSSSVFLNLLGPILVGPLGWRGNFALFSGLGLVALAVFIRRGEPPSDQPLAQLRVPLKEARQLLRLRAMWLVAAIQYVRLAVVFGINVWLPTYVVVERHYSLAVAGALVALVAALGATATIVGGFLTDRLGRPMLVIGASLGVCACDLILLAHSRSLATLVIAVAISGVFSQLYFGPLFAVPVQMFGLRNAGFISGFGNGFANLGAFTFIFLLGVIRDATGSFNAGFDAIAGACVVGVLATAALARERSRERRASGRSVVGDAAG
jgi:ACS family D-galactonate transporter-like MFS transporter